MTESESHSRQTMGPFLGALALIVVLVVIVAVLIRYFKRKKWF